MWRELRKVFQGKNIFGLSFEDKYKLVRYVKGEGENG